MNGPKARDGLCVLEIFLDFESLLSAYTVYMWRFVIFTAYNTTNSTEADISMDLIRNLTLKHTDPVTEFWE